MQNPFLEISQKLDSVLSRLDEIESKENTTRKLTITEFMEQYGKSRPTIYEYHRKGLLRLEKIGGMNYIDRASIKIEPRGQKNIVH